MECGVLRWTSGVVVVIVTVTHAIFCVLKKLYKSLLLLFCGDRQPFTTEICADSLIH